MIGASVSADTEIVDSAAGKVVATVLVGMVAAADNKGFAGRAVGTVELMG